jgi:hypothetical protein
MRIVKGENPLDQMALMPKPSTRPAMKKSPDVPVFTCFLNRGGGTPEPSAPQAPPAEFITGSVRWPAGNAPTAAVLPFLLNVQRFIFDVFPSPSSPFAFFNPQFLMSPQPTKFESFIALTLFALAFVFLGATLDILYHLVHAGWHAADFLINLFFTNP